jgi:hypothetical protein
LGYDRVRNNVVNKVGGLNSIIKPSSNNLVNKELLVPMRKLGKMTIFALFLIYIHFLHDHLMVDFPRLVLDWI